MTERCKVLDVALDELRLLGAKHKKTVRRKGFSLLTWSKNGITRTTRIDLHRTEPVLSSRLCRKSIRHAMTEIRAHHP